MPPEGGETNNRTITLVTSLTQWAGQDGTGVTFGSSAGFMLPNGAMRAPDAAWVLRSRLAPLTPEQKQKFLPLCPDFVAEIRSPSDRLSTGQAKMQAYLDNGARLGWLFDPRTAWSMFTGRINWSSDWRIPPRFQMILSSPALSSVSNSSESQPSRSNGARQPPASLPSVPER
jgi:Uma2 family endonuclease